MRECKWYTNKKVPSDGDEIVIITFYGDKKIIGYYEKESNSLTGDNHLWKWDDVKLWLKLPGLSK